MTATGEEYLVAQRSATSTSHGALGPPSSASVADCSPAVLDAFVAHVEHVPGDASISTAMGSAIARLPDDAMAFTGRTVPFDVSPDTGWSDPDLDDANMEWVRQTMSIVEVDLLPNRYINELSDAGPEVTPVELRRCQARAPGKALKRAWDPTNVFHMNHNVAP